MCQCPYRLCTHSWICSPASTQSAASIDFSLQSINLSFAALQSDSIMKEAAKRTADVAGNPFGISVIFRPKRARVFSRIFLMLEVEEACPVCKSDHYLNPKMVLLVSACYHKICDSCTGRLFAHGSAPCPVCGTILRRSNLVVPTFEDMRVEKECRVRKRLATIFNKVREDFEGLREYNDYLEEVEDIGT